MPRRPLGPFSVRPIGFGAMRLKSYEAGVKWQVADISELNMNLFKADQPLAYIQVLAPNEFLYNEKGLARYTGAEFTSFTVIVNEALPLSTGLPLSVAVTVTACGVFQLVESKTSTIARCRMVFGSPFSVIVRLNVSGLAGFVDTRKLSPFDCSCWPVIVPDTVT